MPLGEYADFDACVTAQQNKGLDVEAARRYCGAIKQQIEGSMSTNQPARQYSVAALRATRQAGIPSGQTPMIQRIANWLTARSENDPVQPGEAKKVAAFHKAAAQMHQQAGQGEAAKAHQVAAGKWEQSSNIGASTMQTETKPACGLSKKAAYMGRVAASQGAVAAGPRFPPLTGDEPDANSHILVSNAQYNAMVGSQYMKTVWPKLRKARSVGGAVVYGTPEQIAQLKAEMAKSPAAPPPPQKPFKFAADSTEQPAAAPVPTGSSRKAKFMQRMLGGDGASLACKPKVGAAVSAASAPSPITISFPDSTKAMVFVRKVGQGNVQWDGRSGKVIFKPRDPSHQNDGLKIARGLGGSVSLSQHFGASIAAGGGTISAAVSSRNTSWGFYGTARQNGMPDSMLARVFSQTATSIASKFGLKPEQVRDYLDSKNGRHLADAMVVEGKLQAPPPWLAQDVKKFFRGYDPSAFDSSPHVPGLSLSISRGSAALVNQAIRTMLQADDILGKINEDDPAVLMASNGIHKLIMGLRGVEIDPPKRPGAALSLAASDGNENAAWSSIENAMMDLEEAKKQLFKFPGRTYPKAGGTVADLMKQINVVIGRLRSIGTLN